MKNFVGWAYTGKKKKVYLKEKIPTAQSNLPPLIERILRRRGLKKEEFEDFLNPKIENLTPYHKWETLKNAIEILKWAIKEKKKVHMHTDYDVDGITSLVMLFATLKKFDSDFTYSVSNRFKGGYGVPEFLFDEISSNNVEIFICLDCGTNSSEIHYRALKKGINLLIIDHHKPLNEISKNVIFCNTHTEGCPNKFKNFSTAGIVLKLCEGIYDSFQKEFPYPSFLRLSSLGLAQDITEMLSENHSIVSIGMKEIPKTKNTFLKALIKSSGLEGKKIISDHIYFRLGPRLNAPGRMEDSRFLIELFFNQDENEIKKGIEKIEYLNSLRQKLFEKTIKEASLKKKNEKFIIAYDPEWHLGILGLVAAKLVEENLKPAFVLSKQGEILKGSGRSVEKISLIEILNRAKDFLENYGGHNTACGLSLKEEKLKDFEEKISLIMEDYEIEEEKIEIEEEIDFKELLECISYFENLEPFGNKNPKPVFLSHNVKLKEPPLLIKNNIYLLKFNQGNITLDGIGFDLESLKIPSEFSLIYSPAYYDGKIRLKFKGFLLDEV